MEKVAVFHPGAQHSYETAKGFQKVGMLAWYATELFFRPDTPPYSILRLLPKGLRDRFERQMTKRYDPDLVPHLVRTFPGWECAQIAMYKLGLRKLGKWCNAHGNKQFARKIGKIAVCDGVALLWGFDTSSLEAFRIAKNSGIICVLEQTISHSQFWRRTMALEKQRHPEFVRETDFPPRQFIETEKDEHEFADLVVCGSGFCATTLIENGVPREKVAVVPYGVDIERFHPDSNTSRKKECRLLFVGGLCGRKGAAYLLQMMEKLGEKRINLTVAGRIWLPERVFRRYSRYIRYLGQVPRDKMPSVYRDADVYVFPSLVEGSSLTIYEAMASGLPVVTTPNSGSVVRDGVDGFVVPAGDLDALCERVELLARDPSLRVDMGKNARQRAAEFTWSKYHERIAGLARQLLKEK